MIWVVRIQRITGQSLESATGIALILTLGAVILTYGKDYAWIGHAFAGITAVLLLIITASTGAMTAKRIGNGGIEPFKLHRKAGLYFSSLMAATFLYGMWIAETHSTPLLESIHGRLGIALLLLALSQALPSLAIKNRTRLRRAHKILGYTLLPLIFLEGAWGLYMGVVEGSKELVLAHSASGGFAALALIWALVEMLYPAKASLTRARIASYMATLFTIAGCWIIGGYNYLTSYGSEVKPLILAGPTPWVHEVIMEAKEHIFIFLPIIAMALSLTLRSMDETAFAGDRRSRRALEFVASTALFLIVLIFLMGAAISNAGRTGGEI